MTLLAPPAEHVDAPVDLADALAHRLGPRAPDVVPLGTGEPVDAGRRVAARVHVTRDAVLVGPFDATSHPACGNCLAVRWQRLRPPAVRDALETGSVPRSVGPWPVMTDFLVDAVAGLLCAASGPVHRLDLASLEVTTVELLPEPTCPFHAQPEVPPLLLEARPVAHGRLRLRSPADYRLPVGALVNPVCGVLGTDLRHDLAAPTTAAVSGGFLERSRAGLHDIGWSGKAASFAASRDLGLLEGLERYAGTRPRGGVPAIVAALADLAEPALDPRDCGEYAAATYDADPGLHRFSPQAPIPWVPGWSLRDDRPLLVPQRTAYYGNGSDVDAFCFECSNGCATGSGLEEAVLCGLLELVERDAFLLGWYSGAPATELDLSGLDDPEVRALLDRADLNGVDVHVFDARVDLPVPVVTGLAVRRDGGPGALSFAAAAALDPVRAVAAALEEALTYLPHRRPEALARTGELEAMAADFDRVVQLADHALLFALPSMRSHARRFLAPAGRRPPETAYADLPSPTGDLRAEVERLADAIAAAGCDVVVVDQTTPEEHALGLRTVRTIAPGLLPIDFGWRRQRALTMPRLRTAYTRAGRPLPLDLAPHRVPHPFP